MRLTAKRIERACNKPGRYGDGHGLYLQVVNANNRSWLLRYERGGRERWLGLGPLHTIDLKEARERARKARQQLLDGVDPLDARIKQRAEAALAAAQNITFKKAAEDYFAQHEKKWTNRRHRQQFLNSLRDHAFDKIGNLPVASIDRGFVLKVIEPIWGTTTVTANRVRRRIEAVLNWAAVRGYRSSGDNPARWAGNLEHVLPARGAIAKPAHHPALPYNEIAEFMTALRSREGIAAKALQFTILCAARTSRGPRHALA